MRRCSITLYTDPSCVFVEEWICFAPQHFYREVSAAFLSQPHGMQRGAGAYVFVPGKISVALALVKACTDVHRHPWASALLLGAGKRLRERLKVVRICLQHGNAQTLQAPRPHCAVWGLAGACLSGCGALGANGPRMVPLHARVRWSALPPASCRRVWLLTGTGFARSVLICRLVF